MEALISELIEDGHLKTKRIIDAFRKIHRAGFIPEEYRDYATANHPVPIGYNQTISQPLTVAIMLELLQPLPGHHILDIGAGSGWQTALLAEIVGPEGHVFAIERIPALKRTAEKNIAAYNFKNVTLLVGDGTRGYRQGAPYQGIIVAAAAEIGIPDILLEQLAVGGKLVIPVGKHDQDMVLKKKISEHDYTEERIPGFQFVPLVPRQWHEDN
ncbi:MAG: protein-L-isoaspartate(D-aspartate) O-methyltransferase [Candidatus Kerfeldbacteria bacterium]|nr:protein-L-isoaspartate(D-aspartate) O-methyltransferase [Candidatus Kerfeldbacteria bacterium]